MKSVHFPLFSLFLCLVLISCENGHHAAAPMERKSEEPPARSLPSLPPGTLNIVIAGQSNASTCDWSELENPGHSKKMLAIGGMSIQDLLDRGVTMGPGKDLIIWVHGEQDAYLGTDPHVYIEKMLDYFDLIYEANGGVHVPVLISLIGYSRTLPNDNFDAIRNAVIEQSQIDDHLIIAYSDAKTFVDRDMLRDDIHFTKEGCKEMITAFLSAIKSLQRDEIIQDGESEWSQELDN
jgi:hypothetical protein